MCLPVKLLANQINIWMLQMVLVHFLQMTNQNQRDNYKQIAVFLNNYNCGALKYATFQLYSVQYIVKIIGQHFCTLLFYRS